MMQAAEHFQIVLKTLSFIYNQTVLFHGGFREKLVNEILLKGFFFKLFLHWMHEIRRYFLHILVFKIFRTSRKMLPCRIDKALLEEGPSKNTTLALAIHCGFNVLSLVHFVGVKKNSIQNSFNKLRDNIANLRKKDKKGNGLSWVQVRCTCIFSVLKLVWIP